MWLDRFWSAPAPEPKPVGVRLPRTLYQRRARRFRLDLRVSFETDGLTYAGQGLNVSESGLIARFREVPELWTDGQLVLEAGEHYLSITARVARLQGDDAGFAFLGTTENDRAAIQLLMNSVADHPLESEPQDEALTPRRKLVRHRCTSEWQLWAAYHAAATRDHGLMVR